MTGGGKNKNKRKISHFYFYFVLPKVRVGSPVKHFIKNKRPNCAIHTVGGLWMINYFIFRSRGPKESRSEAHLSFI